MRMGANEDEEESSNCANEREWGRIKLARVQLLFVEFAESHFLLHIHLKNEPLAFMDSFSNEASKRFQEGILADF